MILPSKNPVVEKLLPPLTGDTQKVIGKCVVALSRDIYFRMFIRMLLNYTLTGTTLYTANNDVNFLNGVQHVGNILNDITKTYAPDAWIDIQTSDYTSYIKNELSDADKGNKTNTGGNRTL